MKLLLIPILASFLCISPTLKPKLANTEWVYDSSFYSSTVKDTINGKTTLLFKESELLINIYAETKKEAFSYDLDSYIENGNLFRINIGERKKEAYLYGYLSKDEKKLSIISTSLKLELKKELIDTKVRDSFWMEYTRAK